MQKYKQSFDYKIERFANKATMHVGSPMSLILHTFLFIASFLLILLGIDRNTVLLVLTTIVSLEAIYLSLFIQMSVNRSNKRLYMVKKGLDEIQEDVGEIQEDIEGIEKDIDEIQEDVEDIQEDVEGIEKDVDELADEIDEDEIADRARDEMIIQRLESSVAQMLEELSVLREQTAKKITKKDAENKAEKTKKDASSKKVTKKK